MRLSDATKHRLPEAVLQPTYDRRAQAIGIVHFGIGAFHRAHQAWYTDACMDAGERHWAIVGVSLRSGDVATQMDPQDGLYTVSERSAEGTVTRLVGAVREVLVAPQSPNRVVDALSADATHIASFTVTEKGYCRAPDGSLDLALARKGFYPLLAKAFAKRKSAGTGGLTLLSCDNLASNGQVLDRLMREYLTADHPDLLEWFAGSCTCPSSMVDRIVPATTQADRNAIEASIGLRDEAAVVTEPFSQWVIEDRFAGPRPRWEEHGAQIVGDVAPYETAKLRMLNGAHSMLAYCGLDAGHTYVHEAIADPDLRQLAERLMCDEAAPTIDSGQGQDLGGYAGTLLARFENPALEHRLAQIAMDGSQKIPQRWLETLAANSLAGRESSALLTALAAWLRHVRGDQQNVDDPLHRELAECWRFNGPSRIVDAIFGDGGLLASDWKPSAVEREFVELRLFQED